MKRWGKVKSETIISALYRQRHPREILALFPLSVLAGAVLGAFTNAINDWISPEYFQTVTGGVVPLSSQIWAPSIGQGVSKGAMMGAICGLILTLYIGVVSHLQAPLRSSAKALFETLAFTLLFWVIGGINAILLALAVPQFYDLFLGLSASMSDTINFAWIEGSVAGAQWGGLLAVSIACARFGAHWKQQLKATENENFKSSE